MNYNPAPKPRINFNRSLGWNLNNRKDMEITEKIFDGPDCYRWRKVFAWLPTKTIKGKYIWGKTIYKQRYWAVWGTSFHMEPMIEYAELFDIIKDA